MKDVRHLKDLTQACVGDGAGLLQRLAAPGHQQTQDVQRGFERKDLQDLKDLTIHDVQPMPIEEFDTALVKGRGIGRGLVMDL